MLGVSQRHHAIDLLLEVDRRPVCVSALLDVRMMSLRYAEHLPVCRPTLYNDHTRFKVDTTTDRQPVQRNQAWCDVVTNVQLVDETCCGVLDALQWLEC